MLGGAPRICHECARFQSLVLLLEICHLEPGDGSNRYIGNVTEPDDQDWRYYLTALSPR
jgi:hypothetical protein